MVHRKLEIQILQARWEAGCAVSVLTSFVWGLSTVILFDSFNYMEGLLQLTFMEL